MTRSEWLLFYYFALEPGALDHDPDRRALLLRHAERTYRMKHYMAPCHTQPGRQRWHLRCALLHPITFLRTRSVVGL